MSDKADGFPRERYEGPMASEAKAETMELKLHANRGEWVATVHTDRRAAPWAVKLGKRLYIRTGIGKSSYLYDHTERPLSQAEVVNAFDANESVEVVRVEYAGALPVGLDDAPRGYTDGCRKSGMSPESSYIKPSLGHGASGMAFSLDDARDRIERRDATIAEQAAEIERLKHDVDALKFDTGTLTADRDTLRASVDYLKGERDTLRSALEIAGRRSDSQNASIAYFEQESASHDAALAEVTADRDTLRLEVQRLKDLNVEAQDRYAALEAERDELKRERAERMSALQAAMRTIAAQNAQVRAMNEQLDAVTQLIVQRMENSTHE